ncbi:MAG TPA: hypothetical protein VJK54_02570, partial [Chthoniobacterales bacterium]|nr:hypothetical protein [Chthoniobacterales bacterium]
CAVSVEFRKKASTQFPFGQAFNIGGGVKESLSLLELFSLLASITGKELVYESGIPRISDQKVFIADNTKIEQLIDWRPQVESASGVRRMCDWLRVQK